jgi:hypothetical protein
MTGRHHLIVLVAAGAAIVAACGGPREPASRPAPDAAAAPPAASSAHPPMGRAEAPAEIAWTVPPSWSEVAPASAMRRAQYRVPAAAGDAEDGECVVFYFGAGQGGDVRGNVERWAGQFSTPEGGPVRAQVTEIETGGLAVTRVELAGTYHPTAMGMGGSAGEPKPGTMFLGAIVPGAAANWFIRCAGPERTITENRAAFDALIASLRPAS